MVSGVYSLKRKEKKQTLAAGLHQTSSENLMALVSFAHKVPPLVQHCQAYATELELFDFFTKQKLRHIPGVDVLNLNAYQQNQLELNGIPLAERREAARWQLTERLDYPVEEAVIDLFDIALDEAQKDARTFAITARHSLLKARLLALKRPELKLLAMDIPEFALRNVLELFPDQARGICLLWVQANATLLLVVREGCVYFSRLISTGLAQLSENQAANSPELLAEPTERVLEDLILEIQRSLDFCESSFRLPSIAKIWLAFCGDEPPLVVDYLGRYLSAEVRPADFRQVFDFHCEVSTATINKCLPALGAALRAGGTP